MPGGLDPHPLGVAIFRAVFAFGIAGRRCTARRLRYAVSILVSLSIPSRPAQSPLESRIR